MMIEKKDSNCWDIDMKIVKQSEREGQAEGEGEGQEQEQRCRVEIKSIFLILDTGHCKERGEWVWESTQREVEEEQWQRDLHEYVQRPEHEKIREVGRLVQEFNAINVETVPGFSPIHWMGGREESDVDCNMECVSLEERIGQYVKRNGVSGKEDNRVTIRSKNDFESPMNIQHESKIWLDRKSGNRMTLERVRRFQPARFDDSLSAKKWVQISQSLACFNFWVIKIKDNCIKDLGALRENMKVLLYSPFGGPKFSRMNWVERELLKGLLDYLSKRKIKFSKKFGELSVMNARKAKSNWKKRLNQREKFVFSSFLKKLRELNKNKDWNKSRKEIQLIRGLEVMPHKLAEFCGEIKNLKSFNEKRKELIIKVKSGSQNGEGDWIVPIFWRFINTKGGPLFLNHLQKGNSHTLRKFVTRIKDCFEDSVKGIREMSFREMAVEMTVMRMTRIMSNFEVGPGNQMKFFIIKKFMQRYNQIFEKKCTGKKQRKSGYKFAWNTDHIYLTFDELIRKEKKRRVDLALG